MIGFARRATLSPRELADVVGVSESSVKRWIDSERIRAQRTPGGHRRVELLGVSHVDEACLDRPERLTQRLFELLHAGRGVEVEATLLAAVLSRTLEPAALFDGPVRAAMARIGELWSGGSDGVFVEHRASQLLLRALDRIDGLYSPPSDGLLAVGGSISGDASLLPTRMASIVLASQGVYAVNLGADTPGPAFLDAAEQLGADLVWISVGHVSDAAHLRRQLEELLSELADRNLACILGGREVQRLALPPGAARVGRSLSELAALGRDVAERRAPVRAVARSSA